MSLSAQNSANCEAKDKMALAPAVKRSITVRKIAPRKTTVASEHNKENTPKRKERECCQLKKQKVSTPGNGTSRGRSSSATKKAVMPSPILPSTPPPPPFYSQQPATHPDNAMWSQKVRRSYSRLSDQSLNSPNNREALFGFERLKTPEVIGQIKTGHSFSGSSFGLNSFTLIDAEDCGSAFPEPDKNIPGVAVIKERRRRRKIQQIGESELDAMAAKLNAEFEEAEVFELVVE